MTAGKGLWESVRDRRQKVDLQVCPESFAIGEKQETAKRGVGTEVVDTHVRLHRESIHKRNIKHTMRGWCFGEHGNERAACVN